MLVFYSTSTSCRFRAIGCQWSISGILAYNFWDSMTLLWFKYIDGHQSLHSAYWELSLGIFGETVNTEIKPTANLICAPSALLSADPFLLTVPPWVRLWITESTWSSRSGTTTRTCCSPSIPSTAHSLSGSLISSTSTSLEPSDKLRSALSN